uniref:Uncharacterized protein n=1 Tax=Hucho hucho TaxID=62062 RepID=A0A4W5LB92_9TELE
MHFYISATLTYDTLGFGEFDDFPETSEPVWILGKEFNALTDAKEAFSRLLVHLYLELCWKYIPAMTGVNEDGNEGILT